MSTSQYFRWSRDLDPGNAVKLRVGVEPTSPVLLAADADVVFLLPRSCDVDDDADDDDVT